MFRFYKFKKSIKYAIILISILVFNSNLQKNATIYAGEIQEENGKIVHDESGAQTIIYDPAKTIIKDQRVWIFRTAVLLLVLIAINTYFSLKLNNIRKDILGAEKNNIKSQLDSLKLEITSNIKKELLGNSQNNIESQLNSLKNAIVGDNSELTIKTLNNLIFGTTEECLIPKIKSEILGSDKNFNQQINSSVERILGSRKDDLSQQLTHHKNLIGQIFSENQITQNELNKIKKEIIDEFNKLIQLSNKLSVIEAKLKIEANNNISEHC